MRTRKKIRILVPLAVAAVALAVASTAWACTNFDGDTYFAGAQKQLSAGKGTVITGVYASGVTQSFPSTGWKLVASSGQCCGSNYQSMNAGPLTFSSGSSPQIGPVSGTVPNPGPGQPVKYQVCFLNEGTGDATRSAVLTAT